MRVFVFAANVVGMRCLDKLAHARDAEIVGVCTHAGRTDGVARVARFLGVPLFDDADLHSAEGRARIAALEPELAFALYYARILKREAIDLFPAGVINLHPSLLPHNRGSYTPTWIILENAPAGATLHYIDDGVDTGPIIAQRAVTVEAWDTGETLNAKLVEACCGLFTETLPDILAGNVEATPQPAGWPPARRRRDVEGLEKLDLTTPMRVGWLLDMLRARTFSAYRGCYFEANGRRVYVRVQLEPEG